MTTLRNLTAPIKAAAILMLLFVGTLLPFTGHVGAQTASMGGAFVPTVDYTVTGAWIFGKLPSFFGQTTCDISVNGSGATVCTTQTGTGNSVQATSPSLTTPTIAGYTMTGTGTIANGATITTPILSGSVTGTYTLTSPTIATATFNGNAAGIAPIVPPFVSSASLGGSPVTLTAAQCGGAFNLDAATGVQYILPSTLGAIGCTYDFRVTVSVTSNAHEIESGNAAHFITGDPIMVATGATLATAMCDGSSAIAYKSNGTTTGGLIGSRYRVTVLSSTLLLIEGTNAGSGSLSTACSASN